MLKNDIFVLLKNFNLQSNFMLMQSKGLTISKFLYSWLLMFAVWYGFTTSTAVPELITGVIVALVVTLITAKAAQCCGLDILLPKRLFYILNDR